MANFDPYKAGQIMMANRAASMTGSNAYTAKTKSEQSAIDRRAKMIELLQGQADAPIEKFSYGGIEAVTPPAAYLAKILSGAMAGYQSGKAGQEQEALDKYQEQARTQDMGTIREAAAMPSTPLNLRPGTQATDLMQMNDMLPKGAEPFTGSIPARRNTMITPEGNQAMFDLTQADRKAVEDLGMRREQSRAEMLTRQLDKQAATDEKQRIADARIAERTLDNERKISAAALKSEEDVTAAKLLADVNAGKAQLAAEQALKPKPLSIKELNVVKTKFANIGELKKQYDILKTNFDLIKNTGAVGLTSAAYKFDENAQKYDTALHTMRNLLTGLTRIPGIGSQSDLEARMAMQSMPERTYDKGSAAMEQQLNSLDSLISGYKEVTKGILSDNNYEFPVEPDDPAVEPKDPVENAEDEPSLDDLKEGSITKFDNGQQWALENGKAKRIK